MQIHWTMASIETAEAGLPPASAWKSEGDRYQSLMDVCSYGGASCARGIAPSQDGDGIERKPEQTGAPGS